MTLCSAVSKVSAINEHQGQRDKQSVKKCIWKIHVLQVGVHLYTYVSKRKYTWPWNSKTENVFIFCMLSIPFPVQKGCRHGQHSPSPVLVLSTTSWIRSRSFNLMDIIRAVCTENITYTNKCTACEFKCVSASRSAIPRFSVFLSSTKLILYWYLKIGHKNFQVYHSQSFSHFISYNTCSW
jgi:hypothetical protein